MSPEEREKEPTPRREEFLSEVRQRREQKKKNEKDNTFWQSVGMMGTVGWSVSVPTAVGALLGRALDGALESGHVFTIFFMLVGLVLGCIVAWRLISERI